MSSIVSRYWRLDERPQGDIEEGHLSLQSRELGPLTDGQILIRTLYLSMDATNRLWMSDMEELYMPPVELGAPMSGFIVGQVVESKHIAFATGELVTGLGYWSEYLICRGEGMQRFQAPEGVPLDLAFGVLAIAGPTAYFGLLDIGSPEPGDTVVVTAAAGAVGALVGQIAKMKGCRVVGVAGSPDKCKWLTEELGFDAAVNYKTDNVLEALKKACPDGIDVHFENVGGEVLDAGLTLMNLNGRVVICGLISMYNTSGPVPGPTMFHNIIMKRLRIEGFVVLDYAERFPEAQAVLSQWLRMGKLCYRLDITDGIETAVVALQKLYTGANTGKVMVKVGDWAASAP